ncbi:MAG: glycosyl transferase [Flavobacterium sp. BFFFF2]|nr:MAG: glycosyl transferase [Flavobacterium sp. BFFFF2]
MNSLPAKNRFFVDCHVFDKGFQGTRTYIQGLYLELIKDHDKHFYFASNEPKNLKVVFGNQANITYLKYTSHSALIRLLFEIPLLILKHRIHFAHFQYRVPPIKLCKYIVTTHDVLFEDFPADFPKLNRLQSFITYKFSAKLSDIIFTVSQYSKVQIMHHLGVKNVVVMPNGVDAAFFQEYNKKEIKEEVFATYGIHDYLIYVSRWEPRKNHHLLLKTFINLKLYENYSLVFVGNDTFHNKEYDQLFNGLDETIQQKIHSFKKVDFSSMLLLIRGASASVYPSRAEGFGIPPLESIAAHIPTICSNTTAMSDFTFFEDYFFNPYSEKDFTEKLDMVLKNKDAQIEAKRTAIIEKYNWVLAAEIFNATVKKYS